MLWITICIIVLLLIGGFLFLIAPGRKVSPEARAAFDKRAYAHRGLYTLDQSIPENSLPAFRRAADAGYGAELDVQLTRDGHLVVFHDDDLQRACGMKERICNMMLEEVLQLRLFETEIQIPLLSEVLDVFNGRYPLIVELKDAPNRNALCEATRQALENYDGPACVESFNPEIVRYFRLNDPLRVRGQLSQHSMAYKKEMPCLQAFIRSRLLTNVLARPQFIAYGIGPKPLSVRICEKMGAMKVCWTVRKKEEHPQRMKQNDMVIFEGYRPE